MSFSLWKKIIDKLEAEKITLDTFSPLIWGESTLHPQFLKFLEYASKVNLRSKIYNTMHLCTSGVFINKTTIDGILKENKDGALNFKNIVIGLDAYSEATYNKIRIGGNFQKVVDNIKQLVKRREAQGLKHPKVVIEFLYQFDNLDEVKPFIGYWKAWFKSQGLPISIGWNNDCYTSAEDTIFIKRTNVPNLEDQEKLTRLHKEAIIKLGLLGAEKPVLKNDCFEQTLGSEKQYRKPCSALWTMLAINYRGLVSGCCFDVNSLHHFGNISEQSFHEIWNSKRLTELRLAHILGNFNTSPLCQRCKNQDGPVGGKQIYLDYLEEIGRSDLKHKFLSRFNSSVLW